MENFSVKKLLDGVRLLSYKTDRFKTTRINIRFAVPLSEQSVCAYAAIPGLIRYTSAKYLDNMAMERHLASLYGASFSALSLKQGDVQVLSFTISSVADRFALNGEKISMDCADFLLDTILNPDLDENGLFKKENLEREKRLIIEEIKAEQSNKMSYSVNEFYKLFFEGEPAALSSNGTEEGIISLTEKELTSAWKKMLKSAQILICAVGEIDTEQLEEKFKIAFSAADRKYTPVSINPHIASSQLKEKSEIQPLEQCKLNLGFSFESDDKDALKVFNMIFGQSEMSKLSKVVREEKSLCYYCSSSIGMLKKVIVVFSGINIADKKQTVEEILSQLKEIQSGNFSDEELEIAKIKLNDSYFSSFDTPKDIAYWFTSQMFYDEFLSAEQYAENTSSVTRQRIIECAKTVKLDTVYSLGGEK